MSSSSTSDFFPGIYVINNDKKSWGIGQIQSVIKDKVTINFEHVGKKVINSKKINLKIIKI